MAAVKIKLFIGPNYKRLNILFLSILLLFAFNIDIEALDKTMGIKLPHPSLPEQKGISQLLKSRYSCRDFSKRALNLDQIAILLWAAAGRSGDSVTSATRTIPSAGATNPLEIYIVIGKDMVEGLKEGLYHYSIERHSLESIFHDRDIRRELSAACLGQRFIAQAAISLIVTARFERTTGRYGQRGIRYVFMEVGHSCQNIYLMVTNLGLGTVEVGAFDDDRVKRLLLLDADTQPIAVMPVGYAR